GTVEPRADVGNDDLIEAWFAAHHLGEGHDHVFGANLGIRGSHFVRIGGCPPLRLGEDVAMVHAVTAIGGTIRRTDDCR
ncbi:glycosyltransferase, partial [Pandoraea pneumonica]